MGLIAPWFLAGLAALAIPLYLHLLRRHKVDPKLFSSIMFFERRTQSSVRHRRLRFYLLLALRCAMLALLALLFAEPFLLRRGADLASARKLVVVAVDRTLSMRGDGRLDAAKREAASAVDGMRGGDAVQVVALGTRLETLTEPSTDRAAAKAAIAAIQPGDGSSSYGDLARFLRGLPAAHNLPVEAHLFSDMQQTALPTAFADLALADRTALGLHPVGSEFPNWTVEAVTAPRSVHGTAKVKVSAVVAGFGTEAARRNATLVVNGRIVESKSVDVPARGRAGVQFAGFDPAYGFNRGEVRIEPGDSLRADDRFLFSTERDETRKVLFVREARQSPQFFRAALESAAPGAYDIETVTVEQAANLDPARYSMVVLADAAELSKGFEERLRSFVERGGGVLVQAGPAVVAGGKLPLLGASASESRYASRTGERFQSATRLDTSHPVLRDPAAMEGVKFFRIVRLNAGDGRVLARVGDDSPLLFEKRIGDGHVLAFAATLDNLSNDFPLHASFVPFVERVAEYLCGPAAGPANITVGATVALRDEKEKGAAVEVLDPEGRRALDLSTAAQASSFTFPREGYWETRSAGGRHSLYAVNADRRESDLARIPDETLALWSGAGGGSGPGGAAGEQQEPERVSLWKYLLAALLVVTIAEFLVADRFQAAAEPKAEKPLARREAA